MSLEQGEAWTLWQGLYKSITARKMIEALLKSDPNNKGKVKGLLEVSFSKVLQGLVDALDGNHNINTSEHVIGPVYQELEDFDDGDLVGNSTDVGHMQRQGMQVATMTGKSSMKENIFSAPQPAAAVVKPEENKAAQKNLRQKRSKNGRRLDSSASTTRQRQTIEDDLTDAQKKRFTEKTGMECNRENIVVAVETKLPRGRNCTFDACWGVKELYHVWTKEYAYRPRTSERIIPSLDEIDNKLNEFKRAGIAQIRNPLQQIEDELKLPDGISGGSMNRDLMWDRLRALIPSLLRREMDKKHAKPSCDGITNAGI